MNSLKVLFALLSLSAFVQIARTAEPAAASDLASYPLSYCIVSGEALDASSMVIKTYGDREVRFCCKSCVGDFKKDQSAFLAKLDAAIVESQLASYPLTVCPVSGEALGSMGDPINQIAGNRLFRLCCTSCIDKLAADPATFAAKLDGAVIAAQRESYTATVCPISGEPLGEMGEAYDYVYAGRLVRLCCTSCIDKFKADPAAAFATLDKMKDGATTDAKSEEDAHDSHDHQN